MVTKKYFVFILLIITSQVSYGSLITASHSLSLPNIVTDPIYVTADFGVPGSRINNIIIDMSFSDNFWDPGESIEFRIIEENETFGFIGLTNIIFNVSLLGDTFHSVYIPRDMYVNEGGISEFYLSITGNGAFVTDMLVTADIATISSPPSLLLFILGLLGLIVQKNLTNNQHNRVAEGL